MNQRLEVPWEKVYDYVLTCGREHDPEQFVQTVLEEMDDLVSFDQGLVYCLDENRRVVSQHLYNIKSRWSNMYLQYYSFMVDTNRKLSGTVNERFDLPFVDQISWEDEPVSEFITDYIMARGVRCTMSMVLFDQNSLPRAVFAFDRTRSAKFSERDMAIARYVAAQLNNLYKNFFSDPGLVPGSKRNPDHDKLEGLLTKREREVVDLLCRGLSPAHVSKTLHISVSTTYKHIAHIYKKLNVSSQQELLGRVLGSK